MFGIPSPPQPLLGDLPSLILTAVCVVLGVLILLWGRVVGRGLLCAAGIFGGLVIAGPAAARLGVNALMVRIVAGFLVGLLALVSARAIWALLTGASFGLIAQGIVLFRILGGIPADQRPVFESADATFNGWALGLGQFTLSSLAALWSYDSTLVLATIVPAVAAPFALALLRDRIARIFVTSLLGAAGVVFAPLVALSQRRPSLWEALWTHWYVPVGIAVLLMAVGLVCQFRGAIRADRHQDDQETDEDDEAQEKSTRKTEKKR